MGSRSDRCLPSAFVRRRLTGSATMLPFVLQSVRRMTLPPAPPERPEFEDDDGNARGDGEGDGGKKKGKKDKGKPG